MSSTTLSWKLAAVAPVLVAAAGLLAACGSGGNTGTTSTSASKTSDTWFTTVKSCDLLSQSQAAAVGFTSGSSPANNDSTENSCEWHQTNSGDLLMGAEQLTYASLSGLGDPVTDVTIAGRPGKMAQSLLSSNASCDLAIEATSGSRLHIVVTIAGSGDQACSIAKQVATDIAPKLPSLSG